MIPNDTPIYSYTGALSSCHQRDIIQSRMEADAETLAKH